MEMHMPKKHYYLLETFEPTLAFGMLAALLGVAASWHYGTLKPLFAVLAVAGIMLAQIAVNLIDDYVDYSSGLDKETEKTKFSGGSVLLGKGKAEPKIVLVIGLSAFAIAAGIGIFLVSVNPVLLPIFGVGATAVLLYARYLTKIPFLSEPLMALSFGLIAIGSFIASGGGLSAAWLFALPAFASGIQVGEAGTANSVPDRKADGKHGRRNAVVMLKSGRNAAVFYIALYTIALLCVASGVILKAIPYYAFAVFLTVPAMAATACGISKYRGNAVKYEKVMALATMAEFTFMLILVLSFL